MNIMEFFSVDLIAFTAIIAFLLVLVIIAYLIVSALVDSIDYILYIIDSWIRRLIE